MEKLIYLLDKAPDGPRDPVGRETVERLVSRLVAMGAYRITANIADMTEAIAKDAPARVSAGWEALGAGLSFWLDNLDRRREIEPIIGEVCARYAGYLVTESVVQGTSGHGRMVNGAPASRC
jgi:hypothetical protein